MAVIEGTVVTTATRTYVYRQGQWWLAVHDRMHYNVAPDVSELCDRLAELLRG